MDSGIVSGTVECCCERIQLGRCFGFNGEGIAQCDSFLSDNVAICHSFDNLTMTFECNVQENCPRIGEDYFPYELSLGLGCFFLFVGLCIIPLWHCKTPLYYICVAFQLNGSVIDGGETHDEATTSNMKFACAILISLAFSLIILACTQRDYEQTMYAVIGIIGSFVLIFVVLNVMNACMDDDFRKNKEIKVMVEANNVYQDLSNSGCLVLSMSFCQISLLGMYVYSLITEGAPDYSETSTFLYYLLGSFIQIAMLGKETIAQTGYFHELQFWVKVGSCSAGWTKDLSFTVVLEEDKVDKKLTPGWFRFIRLFLSIVINFLGKSLVTYLLPIHLAHSGSTMDFILNSVAAYFIMQMDDYSNGKRLVIHNANFVESDDKTSKLTERQETDGTEPLIREDDEKNAGQKEGQDNAHISSEIMPVERGDDLETGGSSDAYPSKMRTVEKDERRTLSKSTSSQDVWPDGCDTSTEAKNQQKGGRTRRYHGGKPSPQPPSLIDEGRGGCSISLCC